MITKLKRGEGSTVKIPPHSLEAEQSVLGGLMIDNTAWDKVADRLQEKNFYRFEHQVIFAAMVKLAQHGKPFDVITVAEALKSIQQLDSVGGEIYLFELCNNTPTAANIEAYADIVREKAIFRRLIEISAHIAENSFVPNGLSSSDVLNEAERKVFEIAQQDIRGRGPINLSSVLSDAVKDIDAVFNSPDALRGLSTGYKDLDDKTGGMQAGDLIIVAGRPSMGKTAFAMNIAEHVAVKDKKPVLVFSMEMPAKSLATRMISSLGRIDQHAMRIGRLLEDDWPRITSTVGLLSAPPFVIDDTPALSPGELRSRARRVAREKGGLGLIIVDYLQLMQIPGFKENRTNEISEISRTLKSIAKELDVPVVALSQLNRGLEQRQDKRPVMSDLRESGGIEQDADLILFIYRDEVYNNESPDKGKAEIIIAKQRNGPIGKVILTFLGKYTRFENYISQKP